MLTFLHRPATAWDSPAFLRKRVLALLDEGSEPKAGLLPLLPWESPAVVSPNLFGAFVRQQLAAPSDIFSLIRRVRDWQVTHLESLADEASEGAGVVWVSELFSSEEVPELAVWPERMPASLVLHHLAQGRALPGSNPAALLRLAARSPLLQHRLLDGEWVDTWTWEDASGVIRLLYALRWRAAARQQAQAA